MISPPVVLLTYTSLVPPMRAMQETTSWRGDGNAACSLQQIHINMQRYYCCEHITHGVKCCDISG